MKLFHLKFFYSQKKKYLPVKFFPFFYFLIFISLTHLSFFNFNKLIHASTFSHSDLGELDSRLKIAARDIYNKVLLNDKKVKITVLEFLNLETNVMEDRGNFLEEQFTELLYEMIPEQVIPYFEIVSLRLEWKRRFPEFKFAPSVEDIVKLTSADWLVTGTYLNNVSFKNVNIKLFDLTSGNLIWETFIESKNVKEKIDKNTLYEDPTINNLDREIFYDSDSDYYFQKNNIVNEDEFLRIPEGMVKIPEGEFIMGSDFGSTDELPDHLVFIDSFFLDKYEVTNSEFKKCLSCERGTGGFDSHGAKKPVVYVDWLNADKFCKFKKKRLPTEAEWEYAARAESIDEYSFGEDLKLIERYAWLESNTQELGYWGSKNVGIKNGNKWGLFDMHGNVMEWVQNYYKSNYFASVRQSNNPKGPSSSLDKNYPLRVVRGGAWGGLYKAGTPGGVRSSKRYAFAEWTRSFQIGFRCAMDIN